MTDTLSSVSADSLYARLLAAASMTDGVATLRELRMMLDRIFQHLTAREKRAFNGLFARTQFVFDTQRVPADMRHHINTLRILGNKAAHEGGPFNTLEVQRGLMACALTVAYFFKQPIPGELQQTYADVVAEHAKEPARKPRLFIDRLRVVVVSVEKAPVVGSVLLLVRNDDFGEFKVELRCHENNDLSYLSGVLQPYQTLNLMQLEQVGQEGTYYRSTPRSLVVLEPDLLISISELAECFQTKGIFPLSFLLKKLLPQDFSAPAFQGNLVNAMLDALAQERNKPFKDLFREAVADQAFQASGYNRETLNGMFTVIRDRHWPNLISFLDEKRELALRLEPTFYAPDYGLEGRLDVLAEYPDDPHRKDVVELKSGSAPMAPQVWPNHRAQVTGYNLLLRSAFGKERTGVSAILYSSAQEDAERHVIATLAQEADLMALRNQVVAWMLELAEGNHQVLSTITVAAAAKLPSFAQKDYERFERLYQDASKEAKAYYTEQLSFVLREWLQARVGMYGSEVREDDADGFAGLWLYEEGEKRKSFNLLPGLQYEGYLPEDDQVSFTYTDDVHHNFRQGDTVLLYRRKEGTEDALRQQILKGRLDEIDHRRLIVSLNNRQLDAAFFEQPGSWVAEHDMFESSFWAATRLLSEVLDTKHLPKVEQLLGMRAPNPPLPITLQLPLLDNQCRVIEKGLAATDYCLIQGPPGTGKTSTVITNLVSLMEKKEGPAVMVAAFTNRAVEEIGIRLRQAGVSFLQLGSRRSAAEVELKRLTLAGDIGAAREFISGHRVFLATVATLANRLDMLRLLRPDLDTLIVDEASQLTEAQLAGLVLRFSKYVLVGDQNQLPPVVAQHPVFQTSDHPQLEELDARALGGSLFERLMRQCIRQGWQHAYTMLTIHFRMHDDIAALVNPWYGYQLHSGTERQAQVLNEPYDGIKNPYVDLLASGRLLFVPSPKELTSKYHETEANRIVQLLRTIRRQYGEGFNPKETVGVVTPWRTQIVKIRQLIGDDAVLQQVNIETVERFQGSENDIILVSMSVYHTGQLALLQSPGAFSWVDESGKTCETSLDRKLLVTLSRARQQIVLLADEQALQGSRHFQSIVGRMKRIDLPA